METFCMLLSICVGNSLVTGEFPTQRPVTQSFDVFFDSLISLQLVKLDSDNGLMPGRHRAIKFDQRAA